MRGIGKLMRRRVGLMKYIYCSEVRFTSNQRHAGKQRRLIRSRRYLASLGERTVRHKIKFGAAALIGENPDSRTLKRLRRVVKIDYHIARLCAGQCSDWLVVVVAVTKLDVHSPSIASSLSDTTTTWGRWRRWRRRKIVDRMFLVFEL